MTSVGTPTAPAAAAPARGARRRWHAATGAVGGAAGLAPHVLHHVSFLAGTALVAGTPGTTLFGGLGLVASIPLLLRLRRRFGTWRAPALALGIFVAMFSLSALVIGPAIRGDDGGPARTDVDHGSHHEEG